MIPTITILNKQLFICIISYQPLCLIRLDEKRYLIIRIYPPPKTMIITEELFIIPYLLLIIDLSAFSAPLSRCMENKDISIVAVALSWIEDPEFIESSERLAEPLISSFSLTRVEALTIVIIEAMCNHNVIATKKKIR